jgi:hypothetical protein
MPQVSPEVAEKVKEYMVATTVKDQFEGVPAELRPRLRCREKVQYATSVG